jgi:hypothetical protein
MAHASRGHGSWTTRPLAYIHTYTHTHIRTYAHTHIYMHIHTYMHTHTYVGTHIRTRIYAHTHTYTHTHIHTYTHTHIHTHTLIRTYAHTHTYTHMHTVPPHSLRSSRTWTPGGCSPLAELVRATQTPGWPCRPRQAGCYSNWQQHLGHPPPTPETHRKR